MMILLFINLILEIGVTSSCVSQSLFQIRSVMNGKCLDIADLFDNVSTQPTYSSVVYTWGKNIQMYDCSNGYRSAQQRWYYDDSTNEIKNVNSIGQEYCLDVVSGNTADGTNIRMWTCDNHPAQKWLLNADGTISNINGGCLDISGGNNNNGANVHIFTCNGNEARQQWIWTAEIKSIMHGKCLDVEGGKTDQGTNVQMFDCNGHNAQKWYYNKLSGEIKNYNADLSKDDLCLDLEGGNNADGTNIRMWPCIGHNAQKWLLNADGTISNINGGCLDIFALVTGNFADVKLWTCNAQQNQIWFGALIPKKSHNFDSVIIDSIIYSKFNGGARLNADTHLPSKSALISDNNRFALALHPNGNLILYFIELGNKDYGKIIWSTNTDQGNTNHYRYLVLQRQPSNLKLYTNTLNNGPQTLWNAVNDGHWSAPSHGYLHDDGNFVVYMEGNFLLFDFVVAYNYFAPKAYSLPDCSGYRSLVTYIPLSSQTYDQARSLGYEWCLSIGLIDGNRDKHEVAAHEHNLYWCDNYASANQACKCIGFKDENGVYSFQINGITYRLEWGGDGNEIQSCEENLKADMNGEYMGFAWSQWNTLYSGLCYIEWDDDVESFKDMIDGNNKNGREAKCQKGTSKRRCWITGCSTSCLYAWGTGIGDRIEWK